MMLILFVKFCTAHSAKIQAFADWKVKAPELRLQVKKINKKGVMYQCGYSDRFPYYRSCLCLIERHGY